MSSALLVFVFLVLVQLLVIAGISLKVSQQAVEQASKSNTTQSTDVVSKRRENAQSTELVLTDTSIKIIYTQLETLLSEQNKGQFNQWVKKHKGEILTNPIVITSFLSMKDLSLTTSSFVSYNRLMDLRDRLIKNGLPAKNITVRISNNQEINNYAIIQVSE
ncbi:hypothetical protein [Endozoicomonas ascidiicola]|uniref:hypothetical protein n=1 Tax=Endozoicomonas ascidiicola TaxID=1698521 RepID=UPI0012FA759C|nr:hypothetical protein [Endozoicomonas ascidiicola]